MNQDLPKPESKVIGDSRHKQLPRLSMIVMVCRLHSSRARPPGEVRRAVRRGWSSGGCDEEVQGDAAGRQQVSHRPHQAMAACDASPRQPTGSENTVNNINKLCHSCHKDIVQYGQSRTSERKAPSKLARASSSAS